MDGADVNNVVDTHNADGGIQPKEALKTDGNNQQRTMEDLEIENKALKELLAENKKTIEDLNKTMVEVKTTNAKLLNQMDVGKPDSVYATMNDLFNRYAKER